MPFIKGYLLGLALIVLVGPVVFTLLQITLQHGVKAGLTVAWGIFMSDVIAVLLCAFGAAQFLDDPTYFFYFGLLGGVLLISFGIYYLLISPKALDRKVVLNKTDYFSFFWKGFLVNFVNPFVFLVWLGIIGVATSTYGFNQNLAWYMAGALLGILTTDSIKAIFANRIQPLLNPAFLLKFYRLAGVALFLFGIRMIWRSMQ